MFVLIMPGLHPHQDNTRWERECEGYIRLVCHNLGLFLSCFEALENMLVNQSRVKGNENVSNVSPHYQRYLITFSFSSSALYRLSLYWENFFVTFESCTRLIVLTQECECLYSCVPRLIHNSSKVSTSTFDENVNQA